MSTNLALDEIETPIGYVDLARARANAVRVAQYARDHGLGWRPHAKTHKSTAVARIQLEAGARGLTAATLRESLDLKVALDSHEVLRALADRAARAGRRVGVLVEMDMGLGRVGVQSVEALVALAREAASLPGVAFRGLLFYPGYIRVAQGEQDLLLADLAGRLSKALESLDLGSARPEDLAYTVLATVVSTAGPGRAVVDAGSKAPAKEPRAGGGFGFLLDHPEVTVASLSEEHGVLDLSLSAWVPEVGERVRVVPNHVCMSVNLQEALLANDGGAHTLLPLEGRGRTPWSG